MKRILSFFVIFLSLIQMGQTVDIEPYRLIRELGRGTAVSMAWNPDGSSILVGGNRGLWLYTPEFQLITFRELLDVKMVAWGVTHFASVQGDGTLSLWTLDEARQIQPVSTLKNSGNSITALAWHDNLLAVALPDAVELWNTTTLLETIPGQVTALAWHQNELIRGDKNGNILFPDGSNIHLNAGEIRSLAVHENMLAAGTATGRLVFLDLTTHSLIAQEKYHTAPINSLAWQENRLASVSGEHFEGSELKVWENFAPIMTVAGTADMIQAAWQGEILAVLSSDHLIRTWNTTTGAVLHTLQGHMGNADTIAWSPDGREIASASTDGLVRIWFAETGEIVATLIGHTRGINAIAWSPDGEMLASAGWDNTVRVWMRGTGKTRTIFTGHTRRVWDIAWSPDSKYLASAGRDLTVQVWNVYTGEVRHILKGAESDLQSVAWYENQIAASTDNGVVFIWDADSGKLTHQMSEGHQYYVWSVAWRPDGQQLLSSSWHDGVMQLWDSDTGDWIATLNSMAVLAVAWNPAGTKLASSSDDGSIRVWKMDDSGGKTTRVINAHHAPINSLEWKPDGSMLASASDDGTIKLWGS